MDGSNFPRRILGFSLLGLALAAAPSWAADEVWVSSGQPSGGQVFKVVVNPADPSTLFALANPGVFESTDGGASWNLAFSMNDSDGIDLAIDPVQPSNLYVAGHDTGLYKSSDGGLTWSHLDGISKAHVVVVDPVNEGVVYTIANGDFINGCDVYKSVDGGATWNLIDTGMSGLTGNADAYCTQIAVDPVNPQLLYLATQVGSYQGSIGARGGDALSGLYTSTDGGAHWTQNLPTLAFADVVIDPNDDQNVYAGDYASNDAGANWAPIAGLPTNLPGDRFTVIAVDPTDSQVMWGVDTAGIAGSLWTTTDQGATWNPVSMPHGNAVYNLAFDPTTSATVYASSMAFGVYKSTDGGSNWADSTDGLTGVYSFDILMDSTGAIYMGTEGTGIFKSTDGGATWTMKDHGIAVSIGSAGITAHALVEASTPGTLYETDQNALYKTTDGGDTWSDVSYRSYGSLNALAVDPEQADTVYLGTGGYVLKSIDGGANWTPSVSGLPADGVWSLAVDPTDSDVLYAGGFDTGLSKSTDGGVTWSSAGVGGVDGIGCIAVDPKTPTNVYACLGNAGVYKSTDGGTTWAKAGDLPNYAFRILQIDPNDTAVIYAAIPNFGVYVSTDAGTHWVQLGDPSASSASARPLEVVATEGPSPKTSSASASPPAKITSITVDPRHAAQLYAVASDGQVYSYESIQPQSTGGASGGSPQAGSSSSGGGSFSLLTGLMLLGLGILRRRR